MGRSISIEAAGLITDRLEGLVVSEPNFRPGGGFFSRQIYSHSEEEFINRHWHRTTENESGPWAGSLAADALWAVWRGAASLIAGGDWHEQFIKLPVRKQLICGSESLTDDNVDYLVNAGVSTVILDDCGHCMSWEQPCSLSLALSNFASESQQKSGRN